jgi:drug/metabolite transporter (DMT)-like permease
MPWGLVAATLCAFAANSLLTRAALAGGHLDAASFALVRLGSGAATLWLIVRLRSGRAPAAEPLASALWLAGYTVCFTLAYVRIGAAVGALLLFGAVQVTMIGAGLARGERPARIDWLGVALAGAGLVVLTRPGLAAPDPIGAALMLAAGACWGAYSLAGRGGADPAGRTALNFARATLLAAPLWLAAPGPTTLTAPGLGLALASGGLASGVGYTLWYAVLPHLAAWRAAVVQLVVPVLTALLAALLLGEALTMRLAVATALVATGVWLTVWPSRHR